MEIKKQGVKHFFPKERGTELLVVLKQTLTALRHIQTPLSREERASLPKGP